MGISSLYQTDENLRRYFEIIRLKAPYVKGKLCFFFVLGSFIPSVDAADGSYRYAQAVHHQQTYQKPACNSICKPV